MVSTRNQSNANSENVGGLKAAARLATLAWLLGCAGVEEPEPSRTKTGENAPTANVPAGSGPGGSGMHAVPIAGSAAGMVGMSPALHPGASAGSGGAAASTAGSGGSSAPDTSDAGPGGGTGAPEPTAGGAGSAGIPDPVEYPALQADQIGKPVMVADGFTLAESPLWDPCGERMLFTDVQGGVFASGVIHTLSSSGELGVLATGTTNTNGIAFDLDGSLVLAVMGGGGHLGRRAVDGTLTNIEPAGGPNLHTPDDVTVRSDGTIYFSDGNFYPIGDLLGASQILPVYVLKPGASALESGGTVSGPNGIELSPDEKTLYVSAYGSGSVVEFAVADDGSVKKGEAVVTGLTSNDSLCLDAAGNLYIGVSTGLHVASPDGNKITVVPTPSKVTSCNFGGPDGKTLYITTWTTVFKVEGMPIPGQDWLVNQQRVACP